MRDIDIGLNEEEHMRYQFGKEGKIYLGDAQFHPKLDNFHYLDNESGNFSRLMIEANEQARWQNSQRYYDIIKKLMNEGVAETKRLIRLRNEFTIEAWKEFLEKKMEEESKEGLRYCAKREMEYLENLQASYTERLNYLLTGLMHHEPQCTVEYRAALYYNIFGKGVENFINITKKYGHWINGVMVIGGNKDYDSNDGFVEHFSVMDAPECNEFFY